MSNFEPKISWALERAATHYAEREATVELSIGERRTWRDVSRGSTV